MKILKMLKTALIRWYDRDPFREGAIIAYYAIFSLPGLLVLIITLAGYFFGAEAVSGQLNRQISDAIGTDRSSKDLYRSFTRITGSLTPAGECIFWSSIV